MDEKYIQEDSQICSGHQLADDVLLTLMRCLLYITYKCFSIFRFKFCLWTINKVTLKNSFEPKYCKINKQITNKYRKKRINISNRIERETDLSVFVFLLSTCCSTVHAMYYQSLCDIIDAIVLNTDIWKYGLCFFITFQIL